MLIPGNTYSDFRSRDGNAGSPGVYAKNGSGILIEYGRNITIRNNIIEGNGNGIQTNGSLGMTRDILVEGNQIYGNGVAGSTQEHNIYTITNGITFQNNYIGPLREGAQGHGLKDRSAGTVVRYNYILGGNRQLDLVDAVGITEILQDPAYLETHVYGNILHENETINNRQIVHYGGENEIDVLRNGTLYFYNNTVISSRTDATTLFRLSSERQHADVRNNIFYVNSHPGDQLELVTPESPGSIDLSNNWFSAGWVDSHWRWLRLPESTMMARNCQEPTQGLLMQAKAIIVYSNTRNQRMREPN